MKVSIAKTDKPIGLASDHAGFEMKQHIIELFKASGIKFTDFGTFSTESVDYPDFAHKLGTAIDTEECELGMTICGSGNGISMAINKHPKVRAALCWTLEIAKLAREHNNANVLSLPARFISNDECDAMVEAFFNTPFEGGRHQNRIDKIPLCK